MSDLSGRTALVTGGTRGIGKAVAAALAATGADVVICGRRADDVARVADELSVRGRAADITSPDDLRALHEFAGDVHLLAAIAGGGGGRPTPLADLDPDVWRETLENNLTGTLLTLREFVPAMVERGRGAVVTMSSAAGHGPTPASAAYGVAKAGVITLTEYVAAEVARSGVRVNCLAPGTVDTEAIAQLPDDIRTGLAKQHRNGRLASVDEVAAAAVYLLGDDATGITGQTVDVGPRA